MSATIRSGGLLAYGLGRLEAHSQSVWAGSTPSVPTPGTPLQDVMFRFDILLNALNSGFYAVPLSIVNFPLSLDGVYDVTTVSLPVADVSSLRTSRYDETFYASTLHGISSFVSILSTGRAPILPSSSDENYCRHFTFKGIGSYPSPQLIAPSSTVASSAPYSDSAMTVTYDQYVDTSFFYAFNLLSRVPASVSNYPYFRRSFPSFVSWLSANHLTYGSGTQYWRYTWSISDYTYTSELMSFVISSNLVLGPYYPYAPCTYNWSYRFTWDLSQVIGSIRAYDASPLGRWQGVSTPVLSNLSASCTDPSRGLSTNGFGTRFSMDHDIGYRGSSQVSQPFQGLDYGHTSSPYVLLNSFEEAVRHSWYDIVPSSTFSAAAAVQNIEGGTATDVLQTVVKLPEYKSMIPDIQEGISLLTRVTKKDLSLATAKEIVDLASSTQLQSSFQWRPLLQLLKIELPKLVEAMAALRSKSSIVIGRGSYDFNFIAGTFGRQSSSLKTRSKIVLDLSARALAASLLGYDSFGVMPKPSNLWDLVPFSFVLNWFAGVGQSMKRVEFAALLSTVPGYYVHTYTLSSPFTSAELTNWSMVSSTLDPLSLRLFYRDVSHYSPLPRDSRFGFGIPTQLPPVGAMGALLWQVLT